MQLKQTEVLKDQLADDLAEFSSFERMSVDCNDLIRAIYKELHGSGAYALGKGREFTAWLRKHYPGAAYIPFERAEGSRMDLAFDGSVAIFFNRKVVLEFLHSLVSTPGADNKLERFNWRALKCNEEVGALRVNTLYKYIFSEPVRWLAGKADTLNDWSLDDSAEVLDLVEHMFIEIAADGHTLLDPSFDPFKSIAGKQPAFAKWQVEHMEREAKSLDGTPHPVHKLALAEARKPAGKGNAQATEKVVELAEKMANAALYAMRDPRRAIRDLLTSEVTLVL